MARKRSRLSKATRDWIAAGRPDEPSLTPLTDATMPQVLAILRACTCGAFGEPGHYHTSSCPAARMSVT
jgi:hypothetical protein